MAILPLSTNEVDRKGERLLHLRGSPYEMGYTQGSLLKEEVRHNIATFVDAQNEELQKRRESFSSYLPQLLAHTPSRFLEEMQGMANGAEVPLGKILLLNLFPEMFHCSGITASHSATRDGQLYHARVLDYSAGKGLQDTAVILVVEPDGRIPFVNVSYAGFIGSVTGMNAEQIAIGEIGGKGYGSWEGMPMAFLLREILENAASLEAAKEVLSETKRTCEYYYVISDGKAQDSFGVYATAARLQFIKPGTLYMIESPENPGGHAFDQPAECVAITGIERYPALHERLLEQWGEVDAQALQEIIRRPVAMESNLHNAIFLPSELKLWVAHAGPEGEPACDQPYNCFSLKELLQPSSSPKVAVKQHPLLDRNLHVLPPLSGVRTQKAMARLAGYSRHARLQ